jgi:WS/DGAT/MGAT family acyltransferase
MALTELSGLDAGFLYIESAETPMHVGSLNVLEPPADLRGSFAARVRKHIAARLHLVPLFTRRLEEPPLHIGHPFWVEAEEVDLDWHVQSRRLKAPAGPRQLNALIAKLHAELLDRARPLWQFTVIEGLQGGRVALYSKIHHATLDGAAGVQLAQALLDITPVPRSVPAPEQHRHARRVSRRRMLGALLSNSLAQYAKLARAVPDAVKALAETARGGASWQRLTGLAEQWLAPRTRFNAQIGVARHFETFSLPLNEFKAVAAALDATVNDLVLTLCSGALARYLKRHKELPERSLIAAVPVSLREQGDARQTNQVTMLPCALGTDAPDAAARLAAIQAGMAKIKTTTRSLKDFIPTDFPSLFAPWLIGGLAQIVQRTQLAERIPLPANLVISNVPGPPVALYLAGARMLAYYPVSIVTHGLALNITLHSYDGELDFGLIACARTVPDLARLIDDLGVSYDELRQLAADRLAPKAAPRKRARGGTEAAR